MMSWIAMALSVAASFPNIQVLLLQKYATDGTYRRKDIPVAAASERLLVDWFLPTFVFVSRSQRTYMVFTGIYQFDICLHHHDRWTGDEVYGDMMYAEYYLFCTHLLIRKKGLASDRHTVCGSVIFIVRKGQIRYRYCRYLLSSGNECRSDRHRTNLSSSQSSYSFVCHFGYYERYSDYR